jgi:hypothetical protein
MGQDPGSRKSQKWNNLMCPKSIDEITVYLRDNTALSGKYRSNKLGFQKILSNSLPGLS